jgi:hypothetical protein
MKMDKIIVYHTTGTNELESLITNGARNNVGISKTAKKQGMGFYVYTTLERAKSHAEERPEHSGRKENGTPIIVSLYVKLNTEEWDLDYEANRPLIMSFLINNLETIKRIPDGEINFRDKKIKTSKTKVSASGKGLVFNTGYMSKAFSGEDEEWGGTDEAETLSEIVKYLERDNPDLVKKFKQEIFKNPAKYDVVLKYTGEKPLNIDRYEPYPSNNNILEQTKPRGLEKIVGIIALLSLATITYLIQKNTGYIVLSNTLQPSSKTIFFLCFLAIMIFLFLLKSTKTLKNNFS